MGTKRAEMPGTQDMDRLSINTIRTLAMDAVQRANSLADAPGGKPDVLLLATGSEVALSVQAFEELSAEGVKARVVSMPSWELFDRQEPAYRESVIPSAVKARVCVEQASTLGWDRFAGPSGEIIGMRAFGASAPQKELQKKFGFVPERIAAAAREQIAKTAKRGRKGA